MKYFNQRKPVIRKSLGVVRLTDIYCTQIIPPIPNSLRLTFKLTIECFVTVFTIILHITFHLYTGGY